MASFKCFVISFTHQFALLYFKKFNINTYIIKNAGNTALRWYR
jgi:hypothetical protein